MLRMGMPSSLSAVSLLVALATNAGLAHAQQSGTGFEVALRTGYAAPIGRLGASIDLSSPIGGQIPLWLDLGSRVLPELFIGAYAQYGFGFDGSGVYVSNRDRLDDSMPDVLPCSAAGVRCTESDIRLGLELFYHPLPRNLIDPWFGLGIGYEWLNLTEAMGRAHASLTLHGIEPVNLQSGVDFALAPHVGLGPFVALTFAQFRRASVECSGVAVCHVLNFSGQLPNGNRKHAWFVFGVHGAYGP
jgi:hypothetical protein